MFHSPLKVQWMNLMLPIQIFNWVSRPQHEFVINAAAAIIILLAITFTMNGIAGILETNGRKK